MKGYYYLVDAQRNSHVYPKCIYLVDQETEAFKRQTELLTVSINKAADRLVALRMKLAK